ncbi:hypothetical protein OROGR_001027 [Orobanche gracilis]
MNEDSYIMSQLLLFDHEDRLRLVWLSDLTVELVRQFSVPTYTKDGLQNEPSFEKPVRQFSVPIYTKAGLRNEPSIDGKSYATLIINELWFFGTEILKVKFEAEHERIEKLMIKFKDACEADDRKTLVDVMNQINKERMKLMSSPDKIKEASTLVGADVVGYEIVVSLKLRKLK